MEDNILPKSKTHLQNAFSTGSLYPIVPQSTLRSDVQKRVQRLNASRTYLPPRWSSAIHPEGKIYFYQSTGLRVVTECNIYNPEVAKKIAVWAAHVEKCAIDQDFVFTESMEIFLQTKDNDCNYYIVDHATQTIFWLSQDDIDDIGLFPVVSPSHLHMQLQAHYWSHVESFCMHVRGLPQRCIDDLILVFSHGLADHLTSSVSAFPYDIAATEKFLSLLISLKNQIHEGYTVGIISRLWGVIIPHQCETRFAVQLYPSSAESLSTPSASTACPPPTSPATPSWSARPNGPNMPRKGPDGRHGESPSPLFGPRHGTMTRAPASGVSVPQSTMNMFSEGSITTNNGNFTQVHGDNHIHGDHHHHYHY